jgi:hypothetical protein
MEAYSRIRSRQSEASLIRQIHWPQKSTSKAGATGASKPRTRKNWTKEEDRLLKHNYTKRGSRYTADLLGRTITSVQHRALRLGIPGNGVRPWTEMEVRYLKTRYPKLNVAQICRTLQRSEQSVRGKINQLGIGSEPPAPWTEGETAYLRAHYGKVRVTELAEELGRSPDAVEIKAGRLGLSRRIVQLSTKDRQWVLDNLGSISFAKMAAKLGVNPKKLMRLAAKEGYRARPNCRAWSEEEDRYIRENYGTMTRRQIAEKLDRTIATVGWRASILGLTGKADR